MPCPYDDFRAARPDLDSMIERRCRNGLHLRRPGHSQVNAIFFSKPLFYDRNGQWEPIDTTLLRDANGAWSAPGIQLCLSEDRRIQIGSGIQQQTSRCGWYDHDKNQFFPVWTIPPAQITADCAVAKHAAFEHRLQVIESGLRETLTLLRNPPGPAKHAFAVETELAGIDLADGFLTDFAVGQIQYPAPIAWDADGKDIPILRYAKKTDGIQYLYTLIAADHLATAQYPVVMDPDLEFMGESGDARLSSSAASASEARDTCTAYSTAEPQSLLGQSYSTYTYACNRQALKFDTSSIPDNAVITSVKLSLMPSLDESGTDFDIQIVKANWASYDPVDSSNKDQVFDLILSSNLDNTIWRNTYDISIGIYYESGELDKTWIDKSGMTYYGLISSRDRNGDTPTGLERIKTYTGNANSAYRPKLLVSYQWPAIIYPPTKFNRFLRVR